MAAAILHALRPFDDGQAVISIWENIGSGRVHAVWAAAQQHAAIEQDTQPRTRHATQHRVAVGAAFAHHAKAADGAQNICTIHSGNRLTRLFGVGLYHQG